MPAGNRRTVSLVLTTAGEKLLEKAMRDTQRELAMPLRKLSPRERAGLCAAMGTLHQVMGGEAPEKIGNARRH